MERNTEYGSERQIQFYVRNYYVKHFKTDHMLEEKTRRTGYLMSTSKWVKQNKIRGLKDIYNICVYLDRPFIIDLSEDYQECSSDERSADSFLYFYPNLIEQLLNNHNADDDFSCARDIICDHQRQNEIHDIHRIITILINIIQIVTNFIINKLLVVY